MKGSNLVRLMAGLVFVAGAGACGGGAATLPPGRPSPGGPILYPAPPDTPRIQFLAAFTNEEDVVVRKGRSLVDRIAGVDEQKDSRVPTIEKPYGIAMNRGRMYVCDSDMLGVVVMDLRARTFERFMPRGEGVLRKPINCAVDPGSGRLFVTDTERGQVVVYDSLRNYVGALGETGDRPCDVFIARTGVWVTDLEVPSVRLYDPVSFSLLRSFAGEGTEESRILAPTNLWVAGEEVFVSDLAAMAVKIFDKQGRYLRSFGTVGRAPGQFARPKGIAVDRSGLVYVVDSAFENVQVFDQEGRVLTYFGGAYTGPAGGGMWLPAKVTIHYEDLDLFETFVDPRFELRYLILVTNQYGPDLVSVYGFIQPRPGASP